MKRLLRSPVFNAVCIGLFTAFYTLVFLLTLENTGNRWQYEGTSRFWSAWSAFLTAGNQVYLVIALVAVTVAVIVLLLARRRPHDEYQYLILKYCLIVAVILLLAAIAVFFLILLAEPVWAFGKFTLFIMVQWFTVVAANLVYVIVCRWK